MELVSIISPTYNCEECLPYFLDSILAQDYNRIQLVMVDDGSTDGTQNVLNSYVQRFNDRGYELIIIRQEINKGQAAAINIGLKHFTGSFLMWMDSDDMLEPECITQMIDYLDTNTEKDFVICDSRYVSYPDFSTLYVFGRKTTGNEDTYFYDVLKGTHNYSLGCGTLLIRSEKMRDAIPKMQIHESRQGQNYQLLLPVLYFCKWGYLHQPLFIRVVRNNSHSHIKRNYQEELIRQREFVILLKSTIEEMNIPQSRLACRLVENRFAHKSFDLAYHEADKGEMKKQLVILVKNRALTVKEFLQYHKICTVMGKLMFGLYHRTLGKE